MPRQQSWINKVMCQGERDRERTETGDIEGRESLSMKKQLQFYISFGVDSSINVNLAVFTRKRPYDLVNDAEVLADNHFKKIKQEERERE